MQIFLGTILLAVSASAFYIIESPMPCSFGDACNTSFSRSYVNNYVFCCPTGRGSSVSSFNNVISCQCGSGTFSSNMTSTIFLNGRQLDATEAQPYIEAMQQAHQQNMAQFNRNMQQFHRNMQQFQYNLRQNMAALQTRVSNMFRFW